MQGTRPNSHLKRILTSRDPPSAAAAAATTTAGGWNISSTMRSAVADPLLPPPPPPPLSSAVAPFRVLGTAAAAVVVAFGHAQAGAQSFNAVHRGTDDRYHHHTQYDPSEAVSATST
jgi:hypothetical protein